MTKLNTLEKIIPADQALANKALSQSLRQIKGVFNSTLPEFSSVISLLETNKGLPLIEELSTPVPTYVSEYYQSQLASGTGPGGSVTIDDLIGTAAGAVHNEQLPIATNVVSTLETTGKLTGLTFNNGNPFSSTRLGIYTVLQYVINDSYTITTQVSEEPPVFEYRVEIPSPQPGAGSYPVSQSIIDARTYAVDTLIALARVEIANIATENKTLVDQANHSYNKMAEQLTRETTNREKAGINFDELAPTGTAAIMSIITNLHTIGTQDKAGGPATFFDAIADRSNIYGQAVVSSLREGRNISRLSAIGITPDTQIPDTIPEPSAIDPALSQLTVEQAIAQIKT